MAAKSRPAGPPRWTYTIGAIIAAGGLIWTVASHFIPKPDSAAAAPTPVPNVSVTGKDNVGVGNMSGGTINNGGSAAPAAQQ